LVESVFGVQLDYKLKTRQLLEIFVLIAAKFKKITNVNKV